MSVGSWTPANDSPATIDAAWLQHCIALVDDEGLDTLSKTLDERDRQQHAPLMRADEETWRPALESLSDEELLKLLRFFTVAEMQLPGWEAGDKSPVIWINRVLRQRGRPLSRELLLWIRENSSNRFIPNGPL